LKIHKRIFIEKIRLRGLRGFRWLKRLRGLRRLRGFRGLKYNSIIAMGA